jgi:hypothetical protein
LDDEEGLEVIVLFREENKVSSRRLVSDWESNNEKFFKK